MSTVMSDDVGVNLVSAADAEFDARQFLQALQRVRNGDFSVQLPGTWTGLNGKIADTFNEIVAANQLIADELQRVGHVVGRQGRTRERARFGQSKGAWGQM